MNPPLTLHTLIVGSLAVSLGMLGLACLNEMIGRLAARRRRDRSRGETGHQLDTF